MDGRVGGGRGGGEEREEGPLPQEAHLLQIMRKAHSKALQMTAENLRPEVLARYVGSLPAEVDVDAAALSAKVVARVVKQSEEAFRDLCERMYVNEKLLALERLEAERQSKLARDRAVEAGQSERSDLLLDDEISPLPGGRRPDELIREETMRLKLAEHSRLLSLAVEAEGLADAETLKAAEVEAALERRLEEVAATEQALTEAANSIP